MNTVINIRTNKEVHNKAQKVFSSLGISTSAGVNMFLRQVVMEKGIPFVPTTNTKKIKERWDNQVALAKKSKRYEDAKSALGEL